MLGLTAMCIVRGLTGFMTFMLAFGLRRMKGVGLEWYGLVLAGSGPGPSSASSWSAVRKHLTEQQLLLCSLWLIAISAAGVAAWGTLFAQVILAFTVGLCGAVAQPSFDAMTQRYIPISAQGRAFAHFGMRQQLIWVIGSLIPLIVSFTLPQGDATMAVLAALGGLTYVSGRRAAEAPRCSTATSGSCPEASRPVNPAVPRARRPARSMPGKTVAELRVVLTDERIRPASSRRRPGATPPCPPWTRRCSRCRCRPVRAPPRSECRRLRPRRRPG